MTSTALRAPARGLVGFWVRFRVNRILRLAQRQRHRCLQLQIQVERLTADHPEVAVEIAAVACPVRTMARAPHG